MSTKFHATQRRERARAHLSTLARGGSPRNPIRVTSAAVIEGRAALEPCPQCGGVPQAGYLSGNRVEEHTRPLPGLRQVDVRCRHCSTPRTLWFAIVDAEPN